MILSVALKKVSVRVRKSLMSKANATRLQIPPGLRPFNKISILVRFTDTQGARTNPQRFGKLSAPFSRLNREGA